MAERAVRSQDFRRLYPALREAVTVTALGRPIGRWIPVNLAIDGRALDGIRPGEPASPQGSVQATLDRANKAGRTK